MKLNPLTTLLLTTLTLTGVSGAPLPDAKAIDYGTYPPPEGGYKTYDAPAGGYGSYDGAPAGTPTGGYGTYPAPEGGYGSYPAPSGGYTTYKKSLGDLWARFFG